MGDPPATPTTQISLDASPSVASSSGANIRKERGAIAAQACDTCRSRKQRCDEQRPKCGTCQKFRLECNYREPIPTKKDRTLVEILDRLKGLDERLLGLETKVDHLSHRGSVGPPAQAFHHLQTTDFASSANPGMIDPALTAAPFNLQHGSSQNAPVGQDQYKYVSSVHQMLGWPAVQQLFASIQGRLPNVNFSSLERDGVSHMLGVHRTESQGLPSEGTMRTERASGVMSTLTWENVRMWSQAYFDTTNLFYPILDRQSFMQETLPSLFRSGFSNSISSTIALLVFALGEVSLEGREGAPVHVYNNGRRSGVKGGTKAHPPGLALFNEARSRMGFDLTECSLENVQIFALASAYYGSCFYPMDFWRMTASASLAFQALITRYNPLFALRFDRPAAKLSSNPGELSSPRRDLIRRAFWHCSILETSLNLELGFPLTGLERMENTVGLPDFSGPFCEDDVISNQQSHFQEHFASQIVLRRLLVNFHNTLNSSAPMSSQLGGVPTPFNSANNSPSLSQLTIQQLASQLEEWRGMLPPHLRWQEDYPGAFPNTGIYSGTTHTPASTPISPSMSHTSQPSSLPPPPTNPSPPLMFTTDLDSPPAHYPYVLDVQVALLRSRYYYTKYLIHRPFLYKALHYPDSVTQDDALGAAECLKASLKWPVAMSPTCKHKRLVPCMFFFTQNFFGILVLLHLSTTVPLLRRIRSTLCGERFEMDASETVGLYLDWLRDLKPIDAGTAWHWEVVRVIYGLEG
ncbi:hypothetical protein B0T21DRAFT_48408 [Apiosordaria backusii]|uniref:Zn(2)-C6 fungal-type domain-containing protein n=1 Tax=Apiosordaria backusii TaxID=314023 RepID=A0AA40AXU2_9PEZI|nr:hypothetical protein B0T21DRAFT_48408 [Apiosordaria backusii]